MTKRLVVPCVLAAAMALAGCGTSAPAPASTTTTTAAKASPTTGATLSGSEFTTRISDAMAAAKSGRQKVTIDTPQGTVTGDGVFTVNGTSSDVDMSMTIAGKAMQVISTGGVMFIKGLLPAEAPKPWLKIDPNAPDAVSQAIGSQVKEASDPRNVVEAYQNATVTVVSVKDGVTQYQVSGLSGAATAAGDVVFYVDEQGRPTQITTNGSGARAQILFNDWGTPVTVTAPPADQVGTLPAG